MNIKRITTSVTLGLTLSSFATIAQSANNLPIASWVTPSQNQEYTVGDTVSVEAMANDTDGSIAGVQLLVDGVAVRTERQLPYNWNNPGNPASDALSLNTLSVGEHQLKVIATDNEGGQRVITRTVVIKPAAINLDFGRPEAVTNWNVITGTTYKLNNLINSQGKSTNINYSQIKPLGGYGTTGPTTSALDYPENVVKDISFNRTTQRPQGVFKLTGLQANQSYNFSFFASVIHARENRQTTYTIAGNSERSASLNPSQNKDKEVSLTVKPNSEGEVIITVNKGAENEHPDGNYYLGALSIKPVETTPVLGVKECNDGIDNDGDGLTDWQYDTGCWGSEDGSETAGTRLEENGWTTFDPSSDSKIIYVSSSDGDDANDGLTPETAKATPEAGFALVRDGYPDFLLLKRGDTWRDTTLTRRNLNNGGVGTVDFKSGRSKTEKMVIGSYGDSTERPKLEVETHFINDHGRAYQHFAITGLAVISYKKEPNTPDFDGKSGGSFRFVGNARSKDIIVEDNYIKYGELTVQAVDDIELRRNVIYRSYKLGTCAFKDDGTRHAFGDPGYRPSGMFMGTGTNGALLEGNVWDENGWNPDLPVGDANNPGACATAYNHNVYLSDVKNTVVTNDLFLRASSIGLKVSGNYSGGVDGLTVDNNLFAEGEIGISMAGNGRVADTHNNALVKNNVFTDIARTKPTTRSFSWGITVGNNNNTRYENNYFVNPLLTRNSYAFGLTDANNRDIIIENNTAHGYERTLSVREAIAWNDVNIRNNRFVTNSGTDPLIYHRGDFANVNYSGNEYFSNFSSTNTRRDGWFDNIYPFLKIDGWKERSGETDATVSTYIPEDEGRNVDSYAANLGIGSTLNDFAREARKQSRFNWRPEYEAKAVNEYIREGYKDINK